MKVRVYKNQDGGVSIIYPAPKSRLPDETEEQWLERVFAKATPQGAVYKDVDKSKLPQSRRFRNAWRMDGIDLNTSKGQVLVELRKIRNAELTITDGLMARAREIGTQQEIDNLKTYRQKLRDLPQVLIPKLDTILDVGNLETEYPRELTVEEYLAK